MIDRNMINVCVSLEVDRFPSIGAVFVSQQSALLYNLDSERCGPLCLCWSDR